MRFERPADFIVSQYRDVQYSSLDGDVIHYNPTDSTNTRACFVITNKQIHISREGYVNPRTMLEILECQKKLEKESDWHPLKCAILQVPRPNHIFVGPYDDELDCIFFGGEPGNPYFRLSGNGHLQRLDFSGVPSIEDENYAWLLTSYIVMSYDSRRREKK